MNSRLRSVSWVAFVAFVSLSLSALAGPRDRDLMGAFMRMEVANQVVAEAQKMSALPEVAEAAQAEQDRLYGRARDGLLAAFGTEDAAQSAFAAFIDAVQAAPADYAALRGTVANGDLEPDIAEAGQFLGDVQSWLRLREQGAVPSLRAWLDRHLPAPADEVAAIPDAPPPVTAPPASVARPPARPQARPAPSKPRNPLRAREARASEFVEEEEDGGSALDTFRAAREARRQKALADAEAGMAQVAEERRIADEEYNAKKQAAASAEAANMEAQAQKLAAAEQDAVIQDQNSWKTRFKNIVGSALGATGSAFLGNVGGRIGEEAARAVFNDPAHR